MNESDTHHPIWAHFSRSSTHKRKTQKKKQKKPKQNPKHKPFQRDPNHQHPNPSPPDPESREEQHPSTLFLRSPVATTPPPRTRKQEKDHAKYLRKLARRVALRTYYETWTEQCTLFFDSFRNRAPGNRRVDFPTPRHHRKNCATEAAVGEKECIKGDVLTGVCQHDVKALLRGCREYGVAFLKKERLRWHPDRFANAGEGNGEKAKEMFQMLMRLLEEEKKAEARKVWVD